MTLDKAIKHAEEVAKEYESRLEVYENIDDEDRPLFIEEETECRLCVEEHRQLAEWLKELKQLREKTGWIPVSEKLPEAFRFVNCTCHSLIDDREDWVIETFYMPQPLNSPYSDWGNIPMLNNCECEVIAWMYRDIPKPYKAESEEE